MDKGVLKEQITKLWLNGEYAQIIEIINNAFVEHGDDDYLFYSRGITYAQMKMYYEAMQDLIKSIKLLELNPDNDINSELYQKNYRKYKTGFSHTIQKMLMAQIQEAFTNSDYIKILETINEFIVNYNDNYYLLYTRGITHLNLKMYYEAIQDIAKALNLLNLNRNKEFENKTYWEIYVKYKQQLHNIFISFLKDNFAEYTLYKEGELENLKDLEINSGIYIVCYSDGTFYIGKTDNIGRRYKEHKRKIDTNTKIIGIFFKPFADYLNTNEEVTIIKLLNEYEFPLKNVDGTGNVYNPSTNEIIQGNYVENKKEFEKIISEEEQLRWLYEVPIKYIKLPDNCILENVLDERFKKRNIHNNTITKLTAFFITNIPKVLETEEVYWACMVNTSYKNPISLYVGSRRILYFEITKESAFCHFSACTTPEIINKYGKKLVNVKEDYPNMEITKIQYILNKKIKFDAKININDMCAVLENPLMARGIRTFVLDCMQKSDLGFGKADKHNTNFVYFLYNIINTANFSFNHDYVKIENNIKEFNKKQNNNQVSLF